MLLEIQIQICKLHGLGTLGPRNITVITSYDYSLLHIITVPEVLHDVIIVVFPFTNQTQSQLQFATGPAFSAAWGYCRERRSQRSRSLRTRPLWGPATWTTWNGKILDHQICQCLFNLSCFICHNIHKTVPTVPGRGSHVPAHHNRLISAWVPWQSQSAENNQDLQWFLDISCVSFTEVWKWSSGTVPNLRHARCHCQLASKQWSAQQFRCLAATRIWCTAIPFSPYENPSPN